ncbi:MAG: isochorismatase family protein [Devosiaceae bacterium]|nr:isochorismatase family protein [Devosiaceae bacterium MH13]
MSPALIDAARSVLLVIDVQERLLPAMDGATELVDSCAFLVSVAAHCAVPVFVTEQYPQGLGPTAPEIAGPAEAAKAKVFDKTAFSAARVGKLIDRLRKLRHEKRRDQIILCGIESHICVLQSAVELKAAGFEVFVAADAVSSRHIGSRDLALSRLAHYGVAPVSTEMVAFEWVGDAKAKAFKPVSALVRER